MITWLWLKLDFDCEDITFSHVCSDLSLQSLGNICDGIFLVKL